MWGGYKVGSKVKGGFFASILFFSIWQKIFFQISSKTKPVTPETSLPAKNRKLQCIVYEKKTQKNPHFWSFWAKILDYFWGKRGHFWIFGEKGKTLFFIFQYKNHKISMRGFGENLTHRNERQRRRRIYRSESAMWASDQTWHT